MVIQERSAAQPIRAKWKINSIHWGGQILAAAGIFVIVLPLAIYICRQLFNMRDAENAAALNGMKISLATGAVITGLFIVLLAVEFIQDRLFDKYSSRNKKSNIALGDGHYECQHCGARNISALDKRCPICGEEFQRQ